MAFNSQSLAKTQQYIERMQTRMAKVREHAEESMGQAIQSVEVGGTAFAFGYANGRWGKDGEWQVLGLPVDLATGFALSGLALMGGLGRYSEHGSNIGCGALAAFAYRSGEKLGAQAQTETEDQADAHQGLNGQRSAARMGGAGVPVNVGFAPPYVHATVVEEQVVGRAPRAA